MAPVSNEGVKWTELIEAEFIDLVKDKRHLWDPQHQFYINSRLKQCDYKDIGKALRSKWPEHASLFTLANLTAKFASFISQYKKEWKNLKDGKSIKEGKSMHEWEHYQRLNFLEDIVIKETEQSDNLINVSDNNNDNMSENNEHSESPLLGEAEIKVEIDDNVQAEASSILPHTSAPLPECSDVTIVDGSSQAESSSTLPHISVPLYERTVVGKKTIETTNFESRLKGGMSPDCRLLYIKALDTVKEVVNRTNSTACKPSSDADVAFGHYIASALASIPNSQKKEALKIKLMEVLSKAKYSETSGKYTIVKLEGDTCLIPTCWLTEDESHCYWPNCASSTKISNMVEKLTEPDKKNWKFCKVLKIFGTAHGYKRGLEKMKQWVTDKPGTRSSGSDNQKKRRRYDKDSSSDESEIVEDQSSEKDELSDDPPRKKRKSESDSQSSDRKIKKIKDKMELILDKNDKDFRETVVQILNSFSRRLSDLEEPMLASKASATKNDKTDPDVLSDIMKIFPLRTDEEMDNLEIFLTEEENEKLMVSALKVIGGSGDDQLIKNVLKRCISDAVAELYSFLGAKGKKPFKPLRFSSVIFQCVRHQSQSITEDKYASVVANWLRHAKQRWERHDKYQ